MMNSKQVCALILATTLLTACESTRETLGLNPSTPDEFAVMTRAPLDIPPSYSLRPPNPGERRPQEFSAQERGRQSLTSGRHAPAIHGISDSEQALLQRAQALNLSPDVRREIDEENAQLISVQGNVIRDIIGVDNERPLYPVVDAVAETERLRENKQEGRPITDGSVPEINPSSNNWLLP